MQEAVAVYERLGAQRDQRRAAAVMRQLGFRRGSRTPHTRAATGWDALTATERQVASLAAAGLTNPEIGARLFISRRTVQTHLSHVFAKLAVRSRVELASLAASRS
jgi:DNA-binding CsgD family transcriptional regulator